MTNTLDSFTTDLARSVAETDPEIRTSDSRRNTQAEHGSLS